MINRTVPAVLHHPVRLVACAVFMLVLIIGPASLLYAQDHDHVAIHAADSVEVVQTVERFQEALVEGDSLAVAALLLPEAVVLEAGSRETKTEYLSHHFHSDGAFLRAMTRELNARQVQVAGDAAWVASTSRLHGAYRDRQRDLSSAELLVLRRTSEGWRIAAVHWSSRSRN